MSWRGSGRNKKSERVARLFVQRSRSVAGKQSVRQCLKITRHPLPRLVETAILPVDKLAGAVAQLVNALLHFHQHFLQLHLVALPMFHGTTTGFAGALFQLFQFVVPLIKFGLDAGDILFAFNHPLFLPKNTVRANAPDTHPASRRKACRVKFRERLIAKHHNQQEWKKYSFHPPACILRCQLFSSTRPNQLFRYSVSLIAGCSGWSSAWPSLANTCRKRSLCR